MKFSNGKDLSCIIYGQWNIFVKHVSSLNDQWLSLV
jgi:hypothetical protein